MKPMTPDRSIPSNALDHKLALTISSCVKINGAGNAHSLRSLTRVFAVSLSKLPDICVCHQQILSWMTGLVLSSPPTKIAIWLPIFFSVI